MPGLEFLHLQAPPSTANGVDTSMREIRLLAYHAGQCDPKKCTALRLRRFGLMTFVPRPSSIPRGVVLLTPKADRALSPADAPRAERRGLAIIDVSWKRETFPAVPQAAGRALPYLLAAALAPPDLDRTGTFWFGKDFSQYAAAMREGARQSGWLIHDHFSAEPHAAALMYPLYVTAGKTLPEVDDGGTLAGRLKADPLAPADAAGFDHSAQQAAPPAHRFLKPLPDFVHLVARRTRLRHLEQNLAGAQPLPQ